MQATLEQSGFKMLGSYRALTLEKKPAHIPVKEWLAMFHRGELNDKIKREVTGKNLIMLGTNTGLNLLLRQMRGDTTHGIELNAFSIGTGTASPTAADTGLQTPVLSGVIRADSSIPSAGVLTTEWFVTDDELANGTYNEFGLFCDLNIFLRAIISPAHTKGSNEDSLFVHTITATNS